MKTINNHLIAYECVNAIGNSLNLNEMLTEVISTFMCSLKALGGKYLDNISHDTPFISVGKDFTIPKPANRTEGFFIHKYSELAILEIPVSQGRFLFLYEQQADIESHATMLSSIRTKLSNAINACHSVETLHTLNLNLRQQVDEEKSKNKVTEKLMISQSRMAIMGEMVSMIAHQWRQPITVIGMVANNTLLDMRLGEIDSKQIINDLELIDRQVHFLSRTIDDFRNFFRPNKLPQTISFGEIKNELLTIIGKSFENHHISLRFEGDLEAKCITYKNELLQVFLNILNNAKDAFIEREIKVPLILFHLIQKESSLSFLISDNAGGMTQEVMMRIFEPYFSTKNEKNGTGLGLYMSAIIVEKHLKGSIQACSGSDQTTFAVQIPKSNTENSYDVY